MAKAKTRRTGYKCGGCGESGHNARTCPNKNRTAEVTQPDGFVEKKPKPSKAKRKENEVPVEASVDVLAGNKADTTTSPGAFECPNCLKAGVLVLVELQTGNKMLKCEHCFNKTPIKEIVKWGARPTDKPKGQQGGKAFLSSR